MKHTINYIKKKLHNSKLCRNFLLILTVATLCISALCVPISAESPLTDNTTTFNGFWLSNDGIRMEYTENVTTVLYDSETDNIAFLPIKCIITNNLNDDYINGNIIIPESLKVYTEQSTKYAPNVYVDINDTTYCIWNAESSYSHNETVIYFLYESYEEADSACNNMFTVNPVIIDNIHFEEFNLTQKGIFSIFGNIGNWIANAINNVTAMFWTNGSLTFIGVLAIGGLGISIVLLLIRLVSSLLAFRG